MNLASQTSAPPVAMVSDPLFRLIYRSRSLMPRTPAFGGKGVEGLADLLRTARSKNATLGLTGALVLYDDWFAQVLEGPEQPVRDLYDRITRDPRHDSIDLRSAEFAPKRLFGRWAMALIAEHGEADIPLSATATGLSESAAWRATSEQDAVLTQLRDMTRGYGRGS